MEDDIKSVSVVSPDDDLAPSGKTAMVEKWSDHTAHDGVIVDDHGMTLSRCPGTMVAATIDTVEVQMKTPSITQAFFVPLAQLCALTSFKASSPDSYYPTISIPVKWHEERFGTPEACTTNSRHADGSGTSAGSATSWWGVGGDGAPLWWGGGGGGGAGDEPPPLTYEEMTRSPPPSLGLKYSWKKQHFVYEQSEEEHDDYSPNEAVLHHLAIEFEDDDPEDDEEDDDRGNKTNDGDAAAEDEGKAKDEDDDGNNDDSHGNHGHGGGNFDDDGDDAENQAEA